MIEANFKTLNPNQVEFQATITMPLGQWKKIGEQLANSGESYKSPLKEVRNMITDMVTTADQDLRMVHPKEDGDKK